jgi:hypothetical protein
MTNDNYSILIGKLDEFIRKYYKNRLIRGGIFFIALLTVFFLVIILSEYFGQFNTVTRAVIFYSYIGLNVLILWRLILTPAFKLFKLGKIISHEEAAGIIGTHFPEISDKLLNTLQLKMLQDQHPEISRELISASIDQKINKLRPVPFVLAIDMKQNMRYLRYALPPVIIIILIFILAPRVITEPSERIVKYQTTYLPPAPFTIIVLNEKLETFQQEDFLLEIKAEGNELPADLFLEMNGIQYRMEKKSPSVFQYKFRNIQETKRFYVLNDLFKSRQFELLVFPKPIVLGFEVSLEYPPYTGKVNETIENTGDMIVPMGTIINWKFFTRDTRNIFFRWGEELSILENSSTNIFICSGRALKTSVYAVVSANEYLRNADSLTYTVSVIPDNYPTISIEQVRDSIYDKRIYFTGLIKDDYGFSRLTFNYQIDLEGRKDVEPAGENIVELPVSRLSSQQQFFHFFNLDSINIEPGTQIMYHFEIWDNDEVNGNKMTRSQPMIFRAPTMEEIEEKTEENSQKITEDLESSIKEAKELQKKAEELSRKLIDKENIGWQEKQQLQDLLDQQKQLQEKVEKIQKENEIKSAQEQQYKQIDEELIRKQKRLEELFNEVMTDEMKKMFEELQKLLENVDKDKVNEMLEKMKADSKDLEKQLDRNLELFKKLEFEKKLQETIDKLKDLAKKQEDLGAKSEQKNADAVQLKNEQDKLNEEFKQLRDDLNVLEQKNKELEEPNPLKNTDQAEEEIQQKMQEGSEMLKMGKPSKASPLQRNASENIKSLADQMEQMQSDMYSEELGENIEDLREILENLIQLSFDQEGLINRTFEISTMDPQFPSVIEAQNKIKEDLVMVEDSLWALSKRQQMIETFVTREIENINLYVGKALDELTERRKGPAGENQQFVMTSVNNLALLLSEALEQMMNAMQMQCSGQCKKGSPKPGKGSTSMKSMREMQQKLNQQIQQMKQDGNSPAKTPDSRNTANSEGFARMAAQQEAIRRMMEQYQEQMREQGLGNNQELKEMMDQMEKTETELVNKIITQQTIDRLKEIETRLLKHEKAEQIREQEEKRESKEGKDINNRNPEDFLEYNKLQDNEIELLRTIPPNLRPFYKEKVSQYFYYFELH